AEVTEHGKAATGDLRPGDVIVTINGESAAEMLNVEAQKKIKQSPGQLRLEVQSPCAARPPSQGWWQLLVSPSPAQDTLWMRSESQSALRTLDPSLASLAHPPGSARQVGPWEGRARRGSSRGGGSRWRTGCGVQPGGSRNPGAGNPPKISPRATPRSQGSEPAMRRLEEDSEVYKMLQEKRELRAAPRQSSTFRLLQEALEDEEGGGPAAPFPSRLSAGARKPVAGGQKLHVCEKCGSSIA
ncbi:PDLI2 protein, partial [Ploceus nigricollis]|nr:PDLI2 protein [Ploceus nigricollis]